MNLHCAARDVRWPVGAAILRPGRELVVRVRGGITVSNSSAFRSQVSAAWEMAGYPARIAVDLSGAGTIDSSGVGELLSLARRAGAAGVPLVLCGVPEPLRRVLRRTGLDRIFRIAETEPAVFASDLCLLTSDF